MALTAAKWEIPANMSADERKVLVERARQMQNMMGQGMLVPPPPPAGKWA